MKNIVRKNDRRTDRQTTPLLLVPLNSFEVYFQSVHWKELELLSISRVCSVLSPQHCIPSSPDFYGAGFEFFHIFHIFNFFFCCSFLSAAVVCVVGLRWGSRSTRVKGGQEVMSSTGMRRVSDILLLIYLFLLPEKTPKR